MTPRFFGWLRRWREALTRTKKPVPGPDHAPLAYSYAYYNNQRQQHQANLDRVFHYSVNNSLTARGEPHV